MKKHINNRKYGNETKTKRTYLNMLFVVLCCNFVTFGCREVRHEHAEAISSKLTPVDSGVMLFDEYLQTLDTIPLPFSHNPRLPLPQISLHYNREAFQKYQHAWAVAPLGILFRNSKTVILIDYSMGDWGPVPLLISFDHKGNKIDSLAPYQKSGSDLLYSAIEYLSIYKNKTIAVLDSVITYTSDTTGLATNEHVEKRSVTLTKYKIDSNGHFVHCQ